MPRTLLSTLRRTSPLFNNSRVLRAAQSAAAQQSWTSEKMELCSCFFHCLLNSSSDFHKNLLQIPAILTMENSAYTGEIIMTWLKKKNPITSFSDTGTADKGSSLRWTSGCFTATAVSSRLGLSAGKKILRSNVKNQSNRQEGKNNSYLL